MEDYRTTEQKFSPPLRKVVFRDITQLSNLSPASASNIISSLYHFSVPLTIIWQFYCPIRTHVTPLFPLRYLSLYA
jgi:hypothetical protein